MTVMEITKIVTTLNQDTIISIQRPERVESTIPGATRHRDNPRITKAEDSVTPGRSALRSIKGELIRIQLEAATDDARTVTIAPASFLGLAGMIEERHNPVTKAKDVRISAVIAENQFPFASPMIDP